MKVVADLSVTPFRAIARLTTSGFRRSLMDTPESPPTSTTNATSSANSSGLNSAGATSAAPKERKPASVRDIYFPRSDRGIHEPIYIASFPVIMYFWPTILACFLGAAVQAISGTPSSTIGWLFVSIVIFNFLVLVHDFDQKRFTILVLGIAVFWLFVWIVNLYGFTFFGAISRWFLSFTPVISTDGYLLLGSLLFILFIWGLTTPLFNYWRFEPNEFVHFTQPVGRDMSIARSQCTIYKEVPDIFECILSGGGGSLVIRRNEQVLATISHVPFLARRMGAIEHLLSETRVYVEKSDQ